MEDQKKSFDVGGLLGGIGQAAGAIYGLFQNKDAQDRRQVEQQKKLTQIAEDANYRAAEHSYDLNIKTANELAMPWQVEKMKEAGINPALAYGMSGGGGVTTGSASQAGVGAGAAANAAATEANKLQMGMQLAQVGLMQAQTEKTKAEAEKIKGADTENVTADTKLKQFQNEVNQLTTAKNIADRYAAESDKIEIESQRANAEWEAFLAAGFKGKTFDNPESPLAKALSAGFENAVQQLKIAKEETNIKKAEGVIEHYKANLAKQGISPDSPWYVKLIGDLLEKVGLPVTKATNAVNQITQ